MKISVVAHFAYGAMVSDPTKHVGGVERQVSILTKWMAKHGHDVTLITWDEGQSSDVQIDGVKIIKLCKQEDGIRGLRFFYPRWTSLIAALKSSNADIYYQNCAEYVTGQIALWCKINNKKFTYSVASEPDCDPVFPQMHKFRDKFLYKYGLLNSSKIIVQNKKQQSMLSNGFNLNSVILNMACQGPSQEEYIEPSSPRSGKINIIWVGRIARVKRPELIFRIASRLKHCTITVIGGVDKDQEFANSILKASKEYPNVSMLGSIDHKLIEKEYKKSSLLCCTSEYEGLPNTFLEAWSHGLPIISTVDPDNTLKENKTGIYCTNIESMIDEIENLADNVGLWKEYSKNSRNYYLKYHALDSAMKKFEETFNEVLQDKT